MKRWQLHVGLALVLAMLTVGCAQEDYGDLGKVTGKVTLDGSPYADAIVTFAPKGGRPSKGVTNADGSYELTYIRATKGAEPGDHIVSIETQAPTQADDYRGPAFKDPIPMRYNRRSELKRTVVQGENTFDFDLKSK